jgi:hypothetical protein
MFGDVLAQVPQMVPLLGRLRAAGASVEEVLEVLQGEAVDYEDRRKQLAAVRFYLQRILWRCGRNWHEWARGATNYTFLLDTIELWRRRNGGEGVCLVTFNYDTMLEDALGLVTGQTYNYLDDYITRPDYRLFKLHGSVTWVHDVRRSGRDITTETLIDGVDYFQVSRDLRVVTGEVHDAYPALAIPLATKAEFECPASHVKALRAWLPNVDKVLVIGWRATERPFVELWHELCPEVGAVQVVANNKNAVAQTLVNLGVPGTATDPIHFRSGFSNFQAIGVVERLLTA